MYKSTSQVDTSFEIQNYTNCLVSVHFSNGVCNYGVCTFVPWGPIETTNEKQSFADSKLNSSSVTDLVQD